MMETGRGVQAHSYIGTNIVMHTAANDWNRAYLARAQTRDYGIRSMWTKNIGFDFSGEPLLVRRLQEYPRDVPQADSV